VPRKYKDIIYILQSFKGLKK